MIGHQDFGIDRSLRQPSPIGRIVENLDVETDRQPGSDSRGSAGRHSAKK
jgi:hypothetical protein